MKKIITAVVLILTLTISINAFSKEKKQSKQTTAGSEDNNPIGMYPPDFLTINGGARVDGGLLDLLSKKGRDSQARSFKITGYNISGKIGLSTLFRTIFIRSFFYILQVFYNLVIHEYECYCTNSHNQINLFLALQNF